MPRSRSRLVVLVNGLPGAGKSTLSRPLSRTLELPLFAKDVIKEGWADVLGVVPPDGLTALEWNALFGAAASETMWRLLADSPTGGVVDSPLLPAMRRFASAGLARAGVSRPVEIWCDLPRELARQRCAARRSSRHAIHGALLASAELPAAVASGPLGIGPVLRVDTTGPVDVDEVARWCRDQAEDD